MPVMVSPSIRGAGPAPKRFRAGTHRVLEPEETIERVRRIMPIMGVTRVANLTGLDTIGIPVVAVVRPNSRSLAVSQGKGLTLAAAKASGLMEAAELYHAERITLPLKLASWNELRFTHAVADVAALPQPATTAFHPDLRLLWIEGVDLLQDTAVWLPYELVQMDCTLPAVSGSGCFARSSNGLASGNHLLEALHHAICEVVERDATALWHCAGRDHQRRTRIDPATVDDPACATILDLFEQADVAIAVWETTSNSGVPSFFCAIVDRTPGSWRRLYAGTGMGCHTSSGIALLRALTEAAQSRLTMIAGARDDMPRGEYEASGNPDVVERARDLIREPGGGRSFSEIPTFESGAFEDDLAWLLDRLRKAGIHHVFAIDLSQPGLDLPVVRVVVPGLEPPHDMPGYVPGPRARAVQAAH